MVKVQPDPVVWLELNILMILIMAEFHGCLSLFEAPSDVGEELVAVLELVINDCSSGRAGS